MKQQPNRHPLIGLREVLQGMAVEIGYALVLMSAAALLAWLVVMLP